MTPILRAFVALTWKTFLRNHMKEIIAIDFFVVPTIRNQVLYVFLVLELERRRVVHFNVTTKSACVPSDSRRSSSHREARGKTRLSSG